MNLPHARHHRGQRILFLILGALVLVIFITLSGSGQGDRSVEAVWQEEATATPQAPVPGAHSGSSGTTDNTNCILCHALPNLTGRMGDSSVIHLNVDVQGFESSVHGRLGCAACHTDLTGYPHPKTVGSVCGQCHASSDPERQVENQLPYPGTREMSIAMKNSCSECHGDVYDEFVHGMHTQELVSGNLQAPVCSDCHGSHYVQEVSRASFSDTCGDCHAAIYTSFQSSVHGASHEWVEPEDAPTCADCHGVHDIIGPRDAGFRQASVYACLKCHQDEKKMARYDLQASMFSADIDNLHAVSLDVYKREDLEIAGSAPVCYECHGVHNIHAADNPGSLVNVSNVTGTCRKCHDSIIRTTATATRAHSSPSAPAAQFLGWMSVYFIPGAFVLMVVYMAADGRKRWMDHQEARRQAKQNQ